MKRKNGTRILSGVLAALIFGGAFFVPENSVRAAEPEELVEALPVTAEEVVEVLPQEEAAEVIELIPVEEEEIPKTDELFTEEESGPVVSVPEEEEIPETDELFTEEETGPVVSFPEGEEIPVITQTDAEEFVLETADDIREEGEEILEGKDPMLSAYNSVGNAWPINVNTTYTDTATETNLNNWYKFTLPAAGYITLSHTHTFINSRSTYWYMYLYNEADKSNHMRQWYIEGVDESFLTRKIGLPAGTYYVCIDPYSYYSKNVTYQFRVNFTQSAVWEKEYNNSFASADLISTNVTYYGTSKDGSDEDYYKFTLPKDGVINIRFRHSYIDNSSSFWRVYLYSDTAKDTTYLTRYYTGNYDSETSTGGIGLRAGTYYVRVETYRDSGADYNLQVAYSVSDVWEKEFNDTFPVATPIQTGKTFYGMSRDYGDEDYYRFTLDSPANVSVRFKHAYRNSGWTYWRIHLYRDSDKSRAINYWNMRGNVTSSKTGTTYLPKGTYYVRVEAYDGNTTDVDYSIYVSPSYGSWKKTNGKWWYRNITTGSYPRNKWQKIDGKWYHFDSDGYMQTGWKKIGGKYYYLGSDGVMRTGWKKIGGKWYYFNSDGIMQTGWKKISGKWYYLGSNGVMRTKWQKISGKWYYFDKSGKMLANTSRKIGKKTYKFNKSGVCTNP